MAHRPPRSIPAKETWKLPSPLEAAKPRLPLGGGEHRGLLGEGGMAGGGTSPSFGPFWAPGRSLHLQTHQLPIG